MSDRQFLRTTILDIITKALTRPKFRANEALADQLTVAVRQAQHDAWTRGYADAQLDLYGQAYGRPEHRSPYSGGRHAGQPRRIPNTATYARTSDGYVINVNGLSTTFHTVVDPERNINNDTDPDAIDLGPKYKRAW